MKIELMTYLRERVRQGGKMGPRGDERMLMGPLGKLVSSGHLEVIFGCKQMRE